MKQSNSTVVHTIFTDGHRENYAQVISKIVGGQSIIGPLLNRNIFKLLKSSQLIITTIDDNYFGYLLIIVIRSIFLKKTKAIFLRPTQCFMMERFFIYRLKFLAFFLVKKLPYVKILSITPFPVLPKLKMVANDWIFDPQLWDLYIEPYIELPDTKISTEINLIKKSKKIVIYIGNANTIKGFDGFCELLHQKNLLLVFAGRLEKPYEEKAETLKKSGMIVINRYISDDEVLSLYKIADMAWCKYDSSYDQASGIFGRAVQTNVYPIYRDGSLISKTHEYLLNIFQSQDQLLFLANYWKIAASKLTN